MKLVAALLFTTFLPMAANAAQEITVNQNDALANLALESAASVCSPQALSNFLDSASAGFQVRISSNVSPSGLKSAVLGFESATKELIVVKPYVLLSAAPSVSPICNLSTKGLSAPN